jgi:lipid-A-disaccharide synthase
MEIFFSVGEPSGDQHAASLIKEMKLRQTDLKCSGYGGPLMEEAGCDLHFFLTNLAVMGIWAVIPLLRQFCRLVFKAGRYFEEHHPDAVVLVDFPGFNWWIARKAKAAGIPVFYYMPPQLWAWAPWRIHRVRKYIDYVLSGLPFEQKWYADRGVNALFVGHPFFDHVAVGSLDQNFMTTRRCRSSRVVGVLPGSRNHEISTNWPLMLEVMQKLHVQHPETQFLVACYKQQHLQMCQQLMLKTGMELPVNFFVGKTSEIIEIAECCLMVSGSVSLEMLARKTPAVVIYRASPWFYPLLRLLVRLDSITLPNLIAGQNLFPEWIVVYFPKRDVQRMATTLGGWLSDRRSLENIVGDLSELHSSLVEKGAGPRAADAILSRLPQTLPRRAA